MSSMIPEAGVPSASSSSDPRRKRNRNDVPNFARSCRKPLPSGSQKPASRPSQPIRPRTSQVKPEDSVAPDSGLLGPWENSITNARASGESFEFQSQFLYNEVVRKLDFDVRSAGTVIKIEAKIGHIIDKKTSSRLSLPVKTEQVIHKDDPDLPVYFLSCMSGPQYVTVNGFLNSVHLDSQPPKGCSVATPTKPRIPISYVHTHECDTLYELSQETFLKLPPFIHQALNSRNSGQSIPKLCLTNEQTSRKHLAQMVKIRLADLDVYSPMTDYDYQISVSVEQHLKGDWRELVDPTTRTCPAYRLKDRLTYRHLAYQIDLTHVISEKGKREHELEIEVSAEKLRKHGMLLRDHQHNEFHKLVQGFTNNIRILAKGSWLSK